MKSIKRGRGPSILDGVISLICFLAVVAMAVFAAEIDLTIAVAVLLLSVIFLAISIYCFTNATGKNRFSEYDFTDREEETDPLNVRFGEKRTDPEQCEKDSGHADAGVDCDEGEKKSPEERTAVRYCPYCGAKLEDDYRFCPGCGTELPK